MIMNSIWYNPLIQKSLPKKSIHEAVCGVAMSLLSELPCLRHARKGYNGTQNVEALLRPSTHRQVVPLWQKYSRKRHLWQPRLDVLYSRVAVGMRSEQLGDVPPAALFDLTQPGKDPPSGRRVEASLCCEAHAYRVCFHFL
jgi:hypothetical protein